MIKAANHWFYKGFFDRYILYILKKDFKKIEIEGTWPKSDKATLMIGNHISWWDGFWVLYLNNRLLKKRLHVMMLEEQLKNYRFLNKIGGFSINPGTRSVMESLNYATELLSDSKNLLLVYPQGKLLSMHQPKNNFEPGIERILKNCNSSQILFYAAFTDYFSERKPTLFFYLKEVEFNRFSTAELNGLYQQFYNESLSNHQLKTQ
jgi:1-acyl-sn-glycerol-3-phosphate acyltransferase